MNGEIAQLIAIAAHGNQFLASGAPEAPDLDRTNTTFQHVGSTRFEIDRETIDDAKSWLEWLRSTGVERLSLRLTERGLISHARRRNLLWTPEWDVVDAPDDRIWLVAFRGRPVWKVTEEGSLDVSRVALAEALRDAESVASSEGSSFVAWFGEALMLLTALDPVPPYHPDMLPAGAGYSLEARQVIAAAARAWVFGGMGSWNDFVPKDEGAYVEAGTKLHRAVTDAFVAAANSFDGSQKGSGE